MNGDNEPCLIRFGGQPREVSQVEVPCIIRKKDAQQLVAPHQFCLQMEGCEERNGKTMRRWWVKYHAWASSSQGAIAASTSALFTS